MTGVSQDSDPVRAARLRTRLNLSAAAIAVGYGLAARLWFGWKLVWGDGGKAVFAVMSVAFIFVVPTGIGFLGAYLSGEPRFWRSIGRAIVPALIALGASLLLAWEGLICIFLWLPLFVGLSALGGAVAYLARRLLGERSKRSALGIAVALPLGVGLTERAFEAPSDARHVATELVVAADPASAWAEIVEVPAIRPEEHGFAWSHAIGFPRPIAAVTTGKGVGSLREASFERGIVFYERVTEHDEGRLLSFTIDADPNTIPAQALDEHVTVGGPYFDVLRGTYRLEPVPGGTRVVLSSDHRLSTHFNAYASLWTDFVMRDTQTYILAIVARRAEARARAAKPSP